MILLGIDPSFSSTGLVLCDTKAKEISFHRAQSKIGEATFSNTFRIALHHRDLILNLSDKFDYVISETPPPNGSYSAGLYQLDSIILEGLLERTPNIYYLSPTYLAYLHRSKKYYKSDSVKLAKQFMEVFKSNGYSFNYERINSDEAEAFIFFTRLFYVLSTNDVIKCNLLKINSRLHDKKEMKLI